MNESDAKTIAESYIRTTNMRGYKAVFSEARKRPEPSNVWAVIFELYKPDGRIIRPSMIVLVDDVTGEVKPFPTL
jgi:hypothetical protein